MHCSQQSQSRTRIKICGLTREADIDAAVAAGADALGFVLWPGSKRALEEVRLAELAARVPAFVTRVGLFVDQEPALIERCAPHLDLLQFHGDESPAFCDAFGRPWIKALRMRQGLDLHAAAEAYRGARALLLDAYRPGVPGGPARPSTGREFPIPWRKLLSLPEACTRTMWPTPSPPCAPSRWMCRAASKRPPATRMSSGSRPLSRR